MVNCFKCLIKLFICILLVLPGPGAQAQASLVQQAIDKIESYSNYSYQSVYRQKEYTDDTLAIMHKDMFLKAPGDTTFGYLFRMEILNVGNKFPYFAVYNGQSYTEIFPEDSTYNIAKLSPYILQGALPGYLKMMNNLVKRKPSRMMGDTIINAVACAHLEVNSYDTIIGKEHYYTRIHLFFDKSSGMLHDAIAKSRYLGNGDGITNYYAEYHFSDYKFNDNQVDATALAIPAGFHLPKAVTEPPGLLAPGTIAPDFVLYSAAGKKLSLCN